MAAGSSGTFYACGKNRVNSNLNSGVPDGFAAISGLFSAKLREPRPGGYKKLSSRALHPPHLPREPKDWAPGTMVPMVQSPRVRLGETSFTDWKPIASAPTDGRMLWISDGKDVWMITAHADGSHREAPLCKFWMDAKKPLPPGERT
jgi:hypothetical protein